MKMNAEDRLDAPIPDAIADQEGSRPGNNGEHNTPIDPSFQPAPSEEQAQASARAVAYRKILDDRAFDPNREPPPIIPVFRLNNITISTPGNLTSITSTIKTGKSALIGAMMASAMNPMGENCDYLGVSSQNPDQLPMLHFDSEQPPTYYWHCIKRALKRAHLDIPPPWFHSFCLTGLNCREAFEIVQEAIRIYFQPDRGLHSIFLDGVADLVSSVNEESECNSFIQRLLDLSIECNCPTIGVIHFNPGTDKTRGHLGSQFERKSETNLRLDKDDNQVTTVWSDKQRLTPIPKNHGPCFQWSNDASMHVSVQNSNPTINDQKKSTLSPIAEDLFLDRPTLRYSDIKSALISRLHCSENTSERKISAMIGLGVIKKSVAGLYVLNT